MKNDTIDREVVDVLIAGGSIAGAAAAAALSKLGLSILIVEPGPAPGRRLAGELIHPPGIEGLCELGLLDENEPLGSAVSGFAIFPANQGEESDCMILPYGESKGKLRCGMAIEHTLLKEHLLDRVATFPGVSTRIGSRVTAMEGDGPFVAVVSSADGDTRVEARLILGADGPMSQMRKMVGISHVTQRYSGMMGAEVEEKYLPHAGYGNIFLNPVGVAYAYAIGGGRARIMFEVLRDADPKESIRTHLSYFPDPLREAVEQNLDENKPLAAANYCIIPEASVKSNFALVGDARGCCHPLTASGITAAVKDALILRDSLLETKRGDQFNFNAALRRFSRICGRLQLTRRTLAEELREAFLSQTPSDLLLNQCIFSYWRKSANGRMRSMELLSMLDSSIYSLAVQYALVALHVFRLFPRWAKEKKLSAWFMGVFKLFSKSLEFQHTALTQWLKA